MKRLFKRYTMLIIDFIDKCKLMEVKKTQKKLMFQMLSQIFQVHYLLLIKQLNDTKFSLTIKNNTSFFFPNGTSTKSPILREI